MMAGACVPPGSFNSRYRTRRQIGSARGLLWWRASLDPCRQLGRETRFVGRRRHRGGRALRLRRHCWWRLLVPVATTSRPRPWSVQCAAELGLRSPGCRCCRCDVEVCLQHSHPRRPWSPRAHPLREKVGEVRLPWFPGFLTGTHPQDADSLEAATCPRPWLQAATSDSHSQAWGRL